MTTLKLNRYRIEGTGLIKFPDGRSGRLRVVLDQRRNGESRIVGRPDLIDSAVEDGIVKISLGDGDDAGVFVEISPRNFRSAAIKPMAAPDLCDDSEQFYIIAKAKLVVSLELAGPVVLQIRQQAGGLPQVAKLLGDPELLHEAHECDAVTLEFCGLSVDTPTVGLDNDANALFVSANPIFAKLGWAVRFP